MNEKNVYTVGAIITTLVALTHFVASRQLHMVWGIDADAAVVFMSQRWSAFALALAWIAWQCRNRPDMYSVVNWALAGSGVISVIGVLLGIQSGLLSGGAWGSFAMEGLLTAAYLYLAIRRSTRSS